MLGFKHNCQERNKRGESILYVCVWITKCRLLVLHPSPGSIIVLNEPFNGRVERLGEHNGGQLLVVQAMTLMVPTQIKRRELESSHKPYKFLVGSPFTELAIRAGGVELLF